MPFLYVIGYGYTAATVAERLCGEGWEVGGTVRDPARLQPGLDVFGSPAMLKAMARADALLVTLPPDPLGDPFLRAYGPAVLGQAWSWVGVLSTTGVYGNTDGAWVDETCPLRPDSARLDARVLMEQQWRHLWRAHGMPVHIFRLAGIYGPGRNALEDMKRGNARRRVKPGHVFSRIHVADIAATVAASIEKPMPGEIFNVCDDMPAPGHEVVAYAAALLNVVAPAEEIYDPAQVSPMLAEFYGHCRRVRNDKIKRLLGVALQYPDYRAGLDALYRETL